MFEDKPARSRISGHAGLFSQLDMMIRAMLASPLRNRLLAIGGAVFLVIAATTYAQIRLNRWNQPFYDALARRDMAAFLHQLLVFAVIAGGLLVLNIGQTWLNQMIRLKLREALTLDLIDQWMRPARAFRLANAGAIGVNPDQRMQQDAAHLSDLSTDLGVGLLQSLILLVSFVGVLWELSSGFVFHVNGWSQTMCCWPHMRRAAFLAAAKASGKSWSSVSPFWKRTRNSSVLARNCSSVSAWYSFSNSLTRATMGWQRRTNCL